MDGCRPVVLAKPVSGPLMQVSATHPRRRWGETCRSLCLLQEGTARFVPRRLSTFRGASQFPGNSWNRIQVSISAELRAILRALRAWTGHPDLKRARLLSNASATITTVCSLGSATEP